MKKKGKGLIALALLTATLTLSGCSRSVINYQIAECIGTVGMYENNEPVETPKMQAERQARESEEAVEENRVSILEEAEYLALGYYYEEAISLLENSEELSEDERALTAISDYQKLLDSCYYYDGAVPHLSFTNVVVDTDRAFDGDDYASIYKQNLITLDEFNAILDSMRESGYVLIDIHSLAEVSDTDSMIQTEPYLPNGKKPLIISVENLNFASMRNGDGVATKLALDDEGNVAAVYTDEGGHDLYGAYDIVTALNAYVEEHPDFSYQGARGIIGLSGVDGLFGYSIDEGEAFDYDDNISTIKAVVAKLREDGWNFACEGYSYQYMGDMNYDTLKTDITKWENLVGSLVGEADVLMYPYGSEVDYTTEKGNFVILEGYRYLIGMWSEGDHLEVNDSYLRQTRRTVTGYMLENYPSSFSDCFSVSAIKDKAR